VLEKILEVSRDSLGEGRRFADNASTQENGTRSGPGYPQARTQSFSPIPTRRAEQGTFDKALMRGL